MGFASERNKPAGRGIHIKSSIVARPLPPPVKKIVPPKSNHKVKIQIKNAVITNLEIKPYNKNSFLVVGDGKIEHYDQLKKLGGRYNTFVEGGPSWVFDIALEPAVKSFLNGFPQIEQQPQQMTVSLKMIQQFFTDLEQAFGEGQEYTADEIREIISGLKNKYI